MNLPKAIPKEAIAISLQGRSKAAIIEELVDLAMRSGRLHDRKAAIKAVMEREKKLSTGMHHGLAIPHGKTDTVDGLVASMGLIPEGVDFQSMDGDPSRIFILTVSPANRPGPHIQFLAEVSRLMNRAEIRESLLQAESAEAIHQILVDG
jgi:PTS system nitrogen regulatory IIA component